MKAKPMSIESPSDYVKVAMHRLTPKFREIAYSRLEAWITETKLTPNNAANADCLEKVRNPRHHCSSNRCPQHRPHGSPMYDLLDHAEYWKGNGEFVVTGHPYADLKMANDLIEEVPSELGFDITVRDASWYNPEQTVLVILRRRIASA